MQPFPRKWLEDRESQSLEIAKKPNRHGEDFVRCRGGVLGLVSVLHLQPCTWSRSRIPAATGLLSHCWLAPILGWLSRLWCCPCPWMILWDIPNKQPGKGKPAWKHFVCNFGVWLSRPQCVWSFGLWFSLCVLDFLYWFEHLDFWIYVPPPPWTVLFLPLFFFFLLNLLSLASSACLNLDKQLQNFRSHHSFWIISWPIWLYFGG